MTSDKWSKADLASHLDITPKFLRARMQRGTVPPPCARAGSEPLWDPATVVEWEAKRTPTAPPTGRTALRIGAEFRSLRSSFAINDLTEMLQLSRAAVRTGVRALCDAGLLRLDVAGAQGLPQAWHPYLATPAGLAYFRSEPTPADDPPEPPKPPSSPKPRRASRAANAPRPERRRRAPDPQVTETPEAIWVLDSEPEWLAEAAQVVDDAVDAAIDMESGTEWLAEAARAEGSELGWLLGNATQAAKWAPDDAWEAARAAAGAHAASLKAVQDSIEAALGAALAAVTASRLAAATQEAAVLAEKRSTAAAALAAANQEAEIVGEATDMRPGKPGWQPGQWDVAQVACYLDRSEVHVRTRPGALGVLLGDPDGNVAGEPWWWAATVLDRVPLVGMQPLSQTGTQIGLMFLASSGPLDADELSAVSGATATTVARYLDLFVAQGWAARGCDGRYALTNGGRARLTAVARSGVLQRWQQCHDHG